MTTTLKALNDYGPRQFGDRIAFSEWQFERALRLELIPAADQGGRWSATVFNDVVARLDAVRAAVGTVPDVGRPARRSTSPSGSTASRSTRAPPPNSPGAATFRPAGTTGGTPSIAG